MKPGQTIALLLVTAVFLAGCGQKGPLYREAPADSEAASEQASTRAQDRNEQAEDR
ncbi:lipoprotein [Marinobacter sp. 71-i]|uniref:Lipoprotein n=1 Tax=Marinobacter iranensis TaxID=2962607 RepID=A0ABT5Y8T2_9GAMM|nr:lipoprotein [Marinobacter iranensis]MDF0749981.1 lipoprotein [Marinobacter iranensis]